MQEGNNKEAGRFNKNFNAFLNSMRNGRGAQVKKVTGKVTQALYLGIALIGLTAVYNITTSEVSGEFKVYEKNEKTGKTELFRFRAKKLQPKIEHKNIVSLEYHGSGARGIDYKRRVGQLLFTQVYLGGGVTLMNDGSLTYRAGMSFSF